MIKSPITKTGDIRYFEVIKIFILISFFFMFFSKTLTTHFAPMEKASSVMVTTLTVLFIFHLLVSLLSEFKELYNILRSFVITFIDVPRLKTKDFVKIFIQSGTQFIPLNKNIYLKLNVIRC